MVLIKDGHLPLRKETLLHTYNPACTHTHTGVHTDTHELFLMAGKRFHHLLHRARRASGGTGGLDRCSEAWETRARGSDNTPRALHPWLCFSSHLPGSTDSRSVLPCSGTVTHSCWILLHKCHHCSHLPCYFSCLASSWVPGSCQSLPVSCSQHNSPVGLLSQGMEPRRLPIHPECAADTPQQLSGSTAPWLPAPLCPPSSHSACGHTPPP